ncbi:MAG: rod shape-determining protein MreC [Firmicutes bacterium]|jgi:rod shape-determining protein MreC|nr:rod shape-determining protein MreC [Bacillota bacterium]
MVSFWRRNKGFIVFSLILAVLIGFFSHTARQRVEPTSLERLIIRALAPFMRASNAVVQHINAFIEDLRGLLSLRARNYELEAKYAALQMQMNLLVEAERENQRLRELLGYKEANPSMTLKLAKVISISQNPWQQELVIDQGSQHGVQVNTPVITHQGFVGRVYEVAPTSSKVVLIIDPRGPVAAQVQETRVRGTLEADPNRPGMLRLIRLPHDANVQVGHTIITAGTAALNLPKGILIGHVEEVAPTPDGLQLVASVRPVVGFNALEDVLLVFNTGGR